MSALNPADDSLDFDLDLDAARSAQAETKPRGVKLGGKLLPLPPELPLDVLEPLGELDVDVSLLIRQAIDAQRQGNDENGRGTEAMLDAILNMFVYNSNLPKDLVACGKLMVARLFGPEGYQTLVENRLTAPEIVKLGRYVIRRYGVSLGESSAPSDSSEGTGTTSKLTSSGSTDSTSAASGAVPALPGS